MSALHTGQGLDGGCSCGRLLGGHQRPVRRKGTRTVAPTQQVLLHGDVGRVSAWHGMSSSTPTRARQQ